MKILTNHLFSALLGLFISFSVSAENITILESQSVNHLHKMDDNWYDIAVSLGHNASIVEQEFLDEYSNFLNTDVLILSSGLIDVSPARMNNILQFVQSGGNVYVQAEYQIVLPGNVLFQYLADNLGHTFAWEGEGTGDLTPMAITGALADNIDAPNLVLDYYWFGAYGSGDSHFESILQYDDKDWGFLFCPSDLAFGKIITTTDQDWVRTSTNDALMSSIVSFLVNNMALDILPTVTINNDSSPCDETQTFTATILDQPVQSISIEWLVNGQVVSGENGLSYSSNSLVDGDVVESRISLTGSCASYEHVSNPILIAPIYPVSTPEISIEADDASVCQGQNITFTANTTQTADVTAQTYQWQVNGQDITDQNGITFSSDQLSDQDVVTYLFIYDDPCNLGAEILSNAIEVSITPTLTPSVNITADLSEICEGEEVNFFAQALDAGSNPQYQWQIDGQNVGANNATFSTTSLSNGQTITCLVVSQELCSTTNEANSNTLSIIVHEVLQPSIEITASADVICSGETISFSAQGVDTGANPIYQWQIDGQNVGANSPAFSTSDLQNGQVVTCMLTVSEACAENTEVASAPISITVNTGVVPTLSIEASATTVCLGEPVVFTASGDNHGANPIFEWFVNGQSVGNNSAQLTIDEVFESQVVACQLINNEACVSSNIVNSNLIQVDPSEILIDVLNVEAENCNNADAIVETQATGGNAPYTFTWSNGASGSSLDNLLAGNYDVTVTDGNGCSAVTSVEVAHIDGPEIEDLIVSPADCEGRNGYAEVTLANPSEEYDIEWIDAAGNTIFTGMQAFDLEPGEYEINVTNQHGCEVFESVTIEASNTLAIAVSEDVRMDLGSTTRLQVLSNDNANVSFEWFPAEGLSCTNCPNPIANPVEDMVYTVVATNSNGCTTSAEVFVQVIPNDDLYIPNAFSPNGDGVNDYFTVFSGQNVARIKQLRVFDRWGAEVYGNQDFMPNIEAEGWSGMYRGKLMDTGVFVFFVEVEYIDGSVKVKKGDITITQ